MIIIDKDIRKLIRERQIVIQSIEPTMPFDPSSQIGPGSIDLRLNNTIRKYKAEVKEIDLSLAVDTELIEVPPDAEILIHPNEIVLATTLEIVILPANMGGLITGRSSVARLGLLVQVSQDFIQPGHSQLVPLQLVNVTDRLIKIKPFLPICQLALFYASSQAEVPYGSKHDAKYRNEFVEPEPSKIGLELGTDKPAHLTTASPSGKYQELKREVERLKKMIRESKSPESQEARLRNVLIVVYIVMGATIGILIQELDVTPFPSLKFIISAAFAVFCLAIVALANWRR